MQPLFRPEAVAHATGRLDGAVLLPAPVAAWGAVAFAVAALAIGGWFGATATYTSKESVPGRLSPYGGTARAVVVDDGTVVDLLVAEGESVEAGAPLARIGTPRRLADPDITATVRGTAATLASNVATARKDVVAAPIGGRVDMLAVRIGQYVRGGDTVAVLVADDELVAELLVPAHLAGFVAVGQILRLNYDALPFGSRGSQQGVVTRVSRTAFSPAEAEATGIPVAGPVFPVRVRLAEQRIDVEGAPVSLRAGMLLTADIVGPPQTLFESLFGPQR